MRKALILRSVVAFLIGVGSLPSSTCQTYDEFELTPDQAPPAPELVTARNQADSSLLWGTYRPQIYFGMRPRLPESILMGLMWFGVQDYRGYAKPRHECSDQDRLEGYSWKYHDGRTFGIQEIRDVENNYLLETSFLKTLPGKEELLGQGTGLKGGSWGARISGTVLDPQIPAQLTTFWYTALESATGLLGLENEEEEDGIPHSESIKLAGSVSGLGDFEIRIEEPLSESGNSNVEGNQHLGEGRHASDFQDTIGKTHFVGRKLRTDQTWRGKDVIISEINEVLRSTLERYGQENMPAPGLAMTLPDEVASASNFYAIQKTFTGNFTFDIFFDSSTTPRAERLSSSGLTQGLKASRKAFDERFESALPLHSRGYTEKPIEFARELTSSLMGGIGFFSGQGIVDRSFAHEYDVPVGSGELDFERKSEPDPRLTESESLFTATPSRSMFPRGFYWDEGFHLAHIGAFDNDMSLEILESWIRLIDEDGWVGREQILGEEARSRVPKEFQTQYPLYANPPTLIMAVTSFIERLKAKSGLSDAFDASDQQHIFSDSADISDPQVMSQRFLESPALAQSFLRSIYSPLKSHYQWFRRTQRGEIKEWDRHAASRGEAYRWRGRTKDHVLTSGLDDYPRAEVPHTGELHLDLMSWMGSFASTMQKIASALGEEDDAEEFQSHYDGIVANLDDLHWSEENQMYCDASVDKDDQSYHVCRKGYISLFPFLLELVPSDSPRLGSILDLLSDPNELWSDYGIRSLSIKEPLFGQGENYWRGPIWVQMNYMALGALHRKYAAQPGPYQAKARKIYDSLRSNVVRNVQKEYERTGFTWEQYNPTDGRGQRSHPFTGWTSTVALIMAEMY
ncbi:glycoside hydrolase [Violaceomyces palustris]|uniref:Glycoside hydrolase n=1 Tax=Violaceomyces palustris TaxID=1673888 RepID=A0ACD0P7I3_9BASI|nr:glycoside hydrolase [Violaceomyces palustris]